MGLRQAEAAAEALVGLRPAAIVVSDLERAQATARPLSKRTALIPTIDAALRETWAGPPICPEAQHPHHALIDAGYMAWARALGTRVNTWTVNDLDEARRLAALGVDVIMSDVPDQIRTALNG